ncbi:MAG: hypothetical protein AB8H79_13120 [Myxococcota bacterium]
MEILLTLALFGVAMTGMAIGVIFSNRKLRGSCGGDSIQNADGESVSCGACPKKEVEICPSDEPLIALAQLAHPNPRHRH